MHTPKSGGQQPFPGCEVLRQRGACLFVLIGKLHRHVAQRAAVGTTLQGSTLNQSVTPAPQTTHGLQPRQALFLTRQTLFGSQRHDRAYQFGLTGREMFVELRLAGAGRSPHVVESDGVDDAFTVRLTAICIPPLTGHSCSDAGA